MNWAQDTLPEDIKPPIEKEKASCDHNNDKINKRKRVHQGSKSDKDEKRPSKRALELETDAAILERRQKQIDYGKNTVGYHNYINQVPITQRTKEQPKTPDKYSIYSRRSWDTLIKIWRKQLHNYDPDAKTESGESDS